MTSPLELARDDLRQRMGRYGLWRRSPGLDPALATAAERAGYGSFWIGGSPPADLDLVQAVLDATERIVIATGIVNIWAADAREVAASYHRIEAAHPGRFILGIGAGHPENHEQAAKPYTGLVDYLDVLDAEGVPPEGRVLAALGDRVLRLAAERSLGAHPYFVPPTHSSRARRVMGAAALLIPEQRVLLETDSSTARDVLRPGMVRYFDLTNYRANLVRLGYDEAPLLAHSDASVDALAAWGDGAAVRMRLDAHLKAGADHVLAQLVVPDGADEEALIQSLGDALR